MQELNALLLESPDYIEARYFRATLLYMDAQYSAAATDLDIYLSAEPTNYSALLLRGLAAHYAKRHREGLAFLNRAIEAQPTNGSTYCRRASVLEALGRDIEAAADSEKCRALMHSES